jgi:RHS repeat-associated protein
VENEFTANNTVKSKKERGMRNETGRWGIDRGLSKLGERDIVYTFGQMRYLTGNGNTEDGLYFYHGNHLSSTQLITDINANISQAVLYTPWGSVIKEYKADWMLDTIPRYLFNAKEKDEESGLYYYEARYYSDENIMFTARDPLFEEKPFMSPYAYCRNNPINMIDPDGRDEWDINEYGEVVNHIETDKHDAFFKVDGNGQRVQMTDPDGNKIDGVCFDYGTVTSTEEVTEKLGTGSDYMGHKTFGNFTTNLFEISGDDNAKQLYDVMRGNTSVEWSCVRVGEENSGKNIVGCTGKVEDINASRTNILVFERGHTIREDRHSHINNNTPSTSDMWHAERVNDKYPNTKLYIDFGKTTTQYNKDGQVK